MKQYYVPQLFEYGTIASLTADIGDNGAPDVFLTVNGTPEPGRTGSIDSCAQEPAPGGGFKCICTDNMTCV